jgi:hypothetical protein
MKMMPSCGFNLLRRRLPIGLGFIRERPIKNSTLTSQDSMDFSIDSFLLSNRCRNRICLWDIQVTIRHSCSVFEQVRLYTSKKHRKKGKDDYDPFQVLGLEKSKKVTDDDASEGILYATVKRTFLKIAMTHHPDTSTADTPEEVSKHREIFLAARKAFEAIVEGSNGIAILRSESEKHKNTKDDDHDFEAWFQNETGHSMPYMDMKTMKEVAEMTETVGGGLDRDGGMWTLARMVTASIKSGGDGKDILSLEAGTIRDRAIDGVLRRKKKR